MTHHEDDFITYAEKNLQIATKNNGLSPLILNKAQSYIHQKLQQQLEQTGKVRAIILKGRQQGCSTYIAARFYWKATNFNATRVFIITHSRDATDNLFSIVEKFHDYVPEEIRQPTKISSAKEKYFHKIASGYRVGTAGSKAVGRSQTIQLLHASEVAFWANAQEHFAGIIQAVPDLPGTEIILESTAFGTANKFHQIWSEAINGNSEYMAIFVPWYWQDEYRKEPPTDWLVDEENIKYARNYNLDIKQIYWMITKKALLGSCQLFMREYPANAAEAFESDNGLSFIPSQLIIAARKTILDLDDFSPKLGGCDPARFGDDRTSFAIRQGRVVEHIKSFYHLDTMEVVGLCLKYINDFALDKLFIDMVGLGAGIFDRLKELGYQDKIIAVNAATSPLDKSRYSNKRAEMWDCLKKWLENPPIKIPDLDSLHSDLSAPYYSYDSLGRLQIEKKESLRKRGICSPDEADALCLTFAFPVRAKLARQNDSQPAFAKIEYHPYKI